VDLPVPAFRLSVGTFLFQDRAQQRAREITRRTGLSARVKAMGPESARMWRVYVGEFTTETEAEAEADRLLSRGIVTEALVESIPGNASR
jgi:cell division septation protein DedD